MLSFIPRIFSGARWPGGADGGIEETAQKLLEVSEKARKRAETKAMCSVTAENAAAAAARRQTDEQV
jgi:hypothetical protein